MRRVFFILAVGAMVSGCSGSGYLSLLSTEMNNSQQQKLMRQAQNDCRGQGGKCVQKWLADYNEVVSIRRKYPFIRTKLWNEMDYNERQIAVNITRKFACPNISQGQMQACIAANLQSRDAQLLQNRQAQAQQQQDFNNMVARINGGLDSLTASLQQQTQAMRSYQYTPYQSQPLQVYRPNANGVTCIRSGNILQCR